MPTTKRSDIIFVDLLQQAIAGAFAGKKALFGTGAALLNPGLPNIGQNGLPLRGGDTIRIPYFDTIGELDDVTEGQALVPVKLSQTSETATVVQSGKAGEMTDWARLMSNYEDPYAEYGRQFVTAWGRRIDKGLIDKAATSALVNDQNGTAISGDMLADTLLLWGDEETDVAAYIMHSVIFNSVRKLKDSQNRYLIVDPAQKGELPTIWGVPVIRSDRMPVAGSPAVYTTAAVKRGALAAWYDGEPTAEGGRDILSASDVTAIHTLHVEHLYKRRPGDTKTGVVLLKSRA